MPDEPRIEVRKDGPLIVKNCKRIVLSDGNVLEEKAMTALCRCGMSNNKPFCDGSHKENGWSDE